MHLMRMPLVRLDRTLHFDSDDLRDAAADGGDGAARARPLSGIPFFHQRSRRQHDELRQFVLAVRSSRGLHPDPAGVRRLFGGRFDVFLEGALRLHIAAIATMAIAVLSFTVWVHHFFTMGQSANINAVFGIATMTIGVPTGVKIYDWIWTMFRGQVRFTVPMLYSLAFMMTFVIGGCHRHHARHATARFSRPQHPIPGRAFPQHADPGAALRHARGLPLLVSQGLRLPSEREVGPRRLRLLGDRLLPGLSCRSTCSARQVWRRRTQEVFEPAFRPWLYIAGIGALVLLARSPRCWSSYG